MGYEKPIIQPFQFNGDLRQVTGSHVTEMIDLQDGPEIFRAFPSHKPGGNLRAAAVAPIKTLSVTLRAMLPGRVIDRR